MVGMTAGVRGGEEEIGSRSVIIVWLLHYMK